MDSKTKQQLDKAIELLYEWKLPEAYNLFRRYFDQLPFRLDADYATYIGMYVRCLLELGKEYELEFYLQHFERAYEITQSIPSTYQLAYVYAHMRNPRLERARQLFEQIVGNTSAGDLGLKAKIMLASYHLEKKNILLSAQLIDSISNVLDIRLQRIVDIWTVILRRHQKRHIEALVLIRKLLQTFTVEDDWYAYFSARIAEIRILLELGQTKEVIVGINSLREILRGKRCKSLQVQIDILLKAVKEVNPFGTLYIKENEQGSTVMFGERTLFIEKTSSEERTLLQLIKKKTLTKEQVVRACRKLVTSSRPKQRRSTSYLDFIRKCLEELGLPKGALQPKEGGYRLLSTVRYLTE